MTILPLDDASVDVVLSVLSLHDVTPATARIRAFNEIARVLKSGGRAFIADYTATRSYAKALRRAGLRVQGPRSAMRPARGLMALITAEKPPHVQRC